MGLQTIGVDQPAGTDALGGSNTVTGVSRLDRVGGAHASRRCG